jgi:hypothetical protein
VELKRLLKFAPTAVETDSDRTGPFAFSFECAFGSPPRHAEFVMALVRRRVSISARMEDPEFDDPRWTDLKGRLLEDARSDFAPFYNTASEVDAHLIDALVLTRAVLQYAMDTPRKFSDPALRAKLERFDYHTEQLFTNLRERVRECPTFAALCAVDQARLVQKLFELRFDVEK